MVQTETSVSASAVPEVVRKRTNALRNLQLKMNEVEAKLSEENHKLECKYAKLFEPIYAQREKIINGEYEPTEEEAAWNYKTGELSDDEESGANGSSSKKQKKDENIRGLPEFWLKAFKSNSLLAGVVAECDEPVLKHLRDVRVKMNDAKIGYTLEFHFNDNEFFTNKVLTKTYELNTEPNKENPLSGHVSPLAKCLGTEIEWKAGKNVIENLKKQQEKKGSGSKKNEEEDEDENESGSFFTFFATRTENGVNPLLNQDAKTTIADVATLAQVLQEFELDYELGNTIKDLIVPKAVLFFTGEMQEDDEGDEFFDEDDEEDDEDDDDDDEEDEESEEEQQPKKKKSSK